MSAAFMIGLLFLVSHSRLCEARRLWSRSTPIKDGAGGKGLGHTPIEPGRGSSEGNAAKPAASKSTKLSFGRATVQKRTSWPPGPYIICR